METYHYWMLMAGVDLIVLYVCWLVACEWDRQVRPEANRE